MKPKYTPSILGFMFNVLGGLCVAAAALAFFWAMRVKGDNHLEFFGSLGIAGGTLLSGLLYLGIAQLINSLTHTDVNTQQSAIALADILAEVKALRLATERSQEAVPLEYYYAEGENKIGPMTATDMKTLASLQGITGETPVYRADIGQWRSFSDFEELQLS